ncbi:hypothetical protein Ancab_004436 [Ancistrocladus abbreviatus]
MVQTLEAIKGGGGSIKVGTVGTISSLITRELESTGSTSHTPSFRSNPPIVGSSTSCNGRSFKPRTSLDEASRGGTSSNIKHSSPETIWRARDRTPNQIPVHSPTTPRRQKQKTLLDEECSRSSKNIGQKSPELSLKTRSYRRAHHTPMLGSENIVFDKTPKREKRTKKGSSIVDIVDVNCGSPSLANRFKRLSFSKLSQSFI